MSEYSTCLVIIIVISCIPPEELKSGRGPAISAFRQWASSQKSLRERGDVALAEKFVEVLRRVRGWRDETAASLGMAPANVMSEHLMRRIAYTLPTSAETLRNVGVRVRGVEKLAAQIASSIAELNMPAAGAGVASGTADGSQSGDPGKPLVLPRGAWQPSAPWLLAEEASWSTKVTKKGMKKANWLLSYERFSRNETCETIAMTQPSGRSIKAATVSGHVLIAMTHGKRVTFDRFAPPHITELLAETMWEELEKAATLIDLNCMTTAKFTMTELVGAIIGEEKMAVPFADRDPALKEEISTWYERVRWWSALKRANVPLSWDIAKAAASTKDVNPAPAKRQRVEVAPAKVAASGGGGGAGGSDEYGAELSCADFESIDDDSRRIDDLDGVDW